MYAGQIVKRAMPPLLHGAAAPIFAEVDASCRLAWHQELEFITGSRPAWWICTGLPVCAALPATLREMYQIRRILSRMGGCEMLVISVNVSIRKYIEDRSLSCREADTLKLRLLLIFG